MEFVFGKKKNPQAVQDLVSALRDFEVTGSLYIGYPIFDINDDALLTDALLVSEEFGVIAFDLSNAAVDDPKVAQAWAAAERVGLNLEQARQDMHAPGVNAVLETDMQDVMAVGVRGPPTFFVNGRALSEFGPEPLRQLVSSEVAKTSL